MDKNFTDMYNSCNLNVGNPLSSTEKNKNKKQKTQNLRLGNFFLSQV